MKIDWLDVVWFMIAGMFLLAIAEFAAVALWLWIVRLIGSVYPFCDLSENLEEKGK